MSPASSGACSDNRAASSSSSSSHRRRLCRVVGCSSSSLANYSSSCKFFAVIWILALTISAVCCEKNNECECVFCGRFMILGGSLGVECGFKRKRRHEIIGISISSPAYLSAKIMSPLCVCFFSLPMPMLCFDIQRTLTLTFIFPMERKKLGGLKIEFAEGIYRILWLYRWWFRCSSLHPHLSYHCNNNMDWIEKLIYDL